MKFNVRYSYNLYLLNFLNVLTGEDLYSGWHKGLFELFGESPSEKSKACMKEAVVINGTAILGPYLSLVISAVPNFQRRSLARMLSVVLFDDFKRYPKSDDQIFEDYFKELLRVLPIGSLDREYEVIMQQKAT